jgi:hypothetical protein
MSVGGQSGLGHFHLMYEIVPIPCNNVPNTQKHGKLRTRATPVPERAETCGRQRLLTGNPNGLRPANVQVDPLRETTFSATGRTTGPPGD